MYRLCAGLVATLLASVSAPVTAPPEQGVVERCPQSAKATATRFRARLSAWEHDQKTIFADPGERLAYTILASDIRGDVLLREESRRKGQCGARHVRLSWDNSTCESQLAEDDQEETCCNPLGCNEPPSRWMYAWMDAVTLGKMSELKPMLPPTGPIELTAFDGTRITYTRGEPLARLTRFLQAAPHWMLSANVSCTVELEGDQMDCSVGGGGSFYRMFWRRPEQAESEATARWYLYRIVGEDH